MKKLLFASLLTGSLYAQMFSQLLVDPYFSPYVVGQRMGFSLVENTLVETSTLD